MYGCLLFIQSQYYFAIWTWNYPLLICDCIIHWKSYGSVFKLCFHLWSNISIRFKSFYLFFNLILLCCVSCTQRVARFLLFFNPFWQTLFILFLASWCSMQDLNSLTRDWTCALLHWEHRVLITALPETSLKFFIFKKHEHYSLHRPTL